MKQITEDYCSFEISKLLKEKGFDESVYSFYKKNGFLDIVSCRTRNSYTCDYAAPTHQMALKWLRENNLYIEIRRNLNTFYFRWKVEQGAADKAVSEYKYDTYEQAVEAALKFTLENLI